MMKCLDGKEERPDIKRLRKIWDMKDIEEMNNKR